MRTLEQLNKFNTATKYFGGSIFKYFYHEIFTFS